MDLAQLRTGQAHVVLNEIRVRVEFVIQNKG